jgi:hypothetical protein
MPDTPEQAAQLPDLTVDDILAAGLNEILVR